MEDGNYTIDTILGNNSWVQTTISKVVRIWGEEGLKIAYK